MAIARVRKAGRCTNGAERDGGRVAHLIDLEARTTHALCGTIPGRLSGGWDTLGPNATLPTCARCQNRWRKWAEQCALAKGE